MDDYGKAKVGKLKLKGKKDLLKKSGKKRRAGDEDQQFDDDAATHGGWWSVEAEEQLKRGGPIALEVAGIPNSYLQAMDTGKFTLGPPHPPGQPPNPEEILSLVKTPDSSKISLKTGFDKFLGIDSQGQLMATADAIGPREKWEFVFQEGQVALQSLSNNCFLSFEGDSEGYIYASSKTAKENEILKLRTSMEKVKKIDPTVPDIDRKSVKECETSYIKMYQHSKVDKKSKMIVVDLEDKKDVKKARNDGNLHEVMLDRRVKTKSDKYC